MVAQTRFFQHKDTRIIDTQEGWKDEYRQYIDSQEYVKTPEWASRFHVPSFAEWGRDLVEVIPVIDNPDLDEPSHWTVAVGETQVKMIIESAAIDLGEISESTSNGLSFMLKTRKISWSGIDLQTIRTDVAAMAMPALHLPVVAEATVSDGSHQISRPCPVFIELKDQGYGVRADEYLWDDLPWKCGNGRVASEQRVEEFAKPFKGRLRFESVIKSMAIRHASKLDPQLRPVARQIFAAIAREVKLNQKKGVIQ